MPIAAPCQHATRVALFVGTCLLVGLGCKDGGKGGPGADSGNEAGVDSRPPLEDRSDTGATDASDAAEIPQCTSGPTSDAGATCNTFDITASWINPQLWNPSDGGVVGDGGPVEYPAGGTLIDGDYDLIQYLTPLTGRTRRTMRLFAGGTRFEWAAEIDPGATGADTIRFNTRMTRSGNALDIALTCGMLITTRYGYTATDDQLFLYTLDANGRPTQAYTYRRTCTR